MAVSIHGNNGVTTTNGTAAAPSLAAPDNDTGLYFGTNLIHASTDGTERLRIHADGEVDVKGGAAGQNALLVTGLYSGGNPNVDIQTWQRTGGQVQAKMIYKDATTDLHFGSHTAHSFSLMTAGTPRVRIASTGKVLIGDGATYSPNGLLHIVGDDNSNGPELYLQVNNNNTTDNIGALWFGNNVDKSLVKLAGHTHTANNTADFTVSTSAAGTLGERLKITSDGDVCINQSGVIDNAKLNIKCDATEPAIAIQANHTNTDTKLISAWNSSGKNIVNITAESDNSPYVKFQLWSTTTNTAVERFRVNHLGNVAIGGGTAVSNRLEITNDHKGMVADSAQPNATLLIKHGTSGSDRRWIGIGASTTMAWLQSSSPGGSGLAAPFLINPGGGWVGVGSNMTPTNVLDVRKDSTTVKTHIGTVNGQLGSMPNSSEYGISLVGNNAEFQIHKDGSGNYQLVLGTYQSSIDMPLVFRTSGRQERIKINKSGRIDIKGDSGNDGFTLSNNYGQAGIFGGMYYDGSSWVRNAISGRKGAGVVVYTGGNVAILSAPENTGTSATMSEKALFSNNGAFRVSNPDQSNDSAINVYKSAGDNTNKAILRVGYDESNSFRIYRTRADSTYYMEGGQSGGAISIRTNNGGSIGERARIDAAGYVHMHNNAFCRMHLDSSGTRSVGAGLFQFTLGDGTYNSFNVGGHYKTSGTDAWKFVCPVAGYYMLHAQFISNSSAASFWMAIRRNGTYIAKTHWSQGSNWDQQIISTVVSANAGDKLDFYNAQTCNFYGLEWTWMYIMKIA